MGNLFPARVMPEFPDYRKMPSLFGEVIPEVGVLVLSGALLSFGELELPQQPYQPIGSVNYVVVNSTSANATIGVPAGSLSLNGWPVKTRTTP